MAATDGILGTQVTWAEFEKELRSALRTEARLGSKKSVLDIGDGNGFVSCCGMITCDWVGAAAEEELPSTVVLKIPSVEPLKRLNDSMPEGQRMFDDSKLAEMAGQLKEIHNNEVAAYDFIAEFSDVEMPKKYYGKPVADGSLDSGHICLEYMNNSKTMIFYEKQTVDQVKQIARALGKIQAYSLTKETTSPQLQKDFFGSLSQTWGFETFRNMFQGMFAVDSSDRAKELIGKIDELLPAYHGAKFGAKIFDEIEFRKVLVNGDLHTGNVLIHKDTNDLLALIDWQCTHLGLGAEDLHRIAISSLSTEDRRASTPALIEEMYKSMVKNLHGAEAPYTLEKLHILADLMFVPAAIFFTSTFIQFIAKMDKDPSIADEEKAKRREVMMDKIYGCLEDILAFDAKNKKHAANLKLKLY